MAPQRDGLDVYNLRAFTAPFPSLKGLSFEAEYALEDNGDALDSTAWNVLAAYQFDIDAGSRSSPTAMRSSKATIRRPPKNEAFDGLLTGFYDWGTWWQGEIAGEYFVSNSNLISHQLRAAREAERRHLDRPHLLRLPAGQARRSAGGDLRRRRHRARLVHGLERQR